MVGELQKDPISASPGGEPKRCFECGATYPPQELACPNDGTPLCFDTVGRRWKIEGILGRRLGGAIFAGFHLVSGLRAAIDMLPGSSARDATALTHFQKQLQALRIADRLLGQEKPGAPGRTVLKLIEEGTERDGSRFFVTELGKARLLQDLLDEWRQPEQPPMSPTAATELVRPLLALLTTVTRLGVAHGSLDAKQIYVTSETDFATGLGSVTSAMLHGLTHCGTGPALWEAQAADLRGLGRVLYELCAGKPLPALDVLARDPLPAALAGPLGQVVLRAVGAPGYSAYASADEMQRALSPADPERSDAPLAPPEIGPPAVAAPAPAPAPPPKPVVDAAPAAVLSAEPSRPRYLSLPPMPSAPQGLGPPNKGSRSSGPALPSLRVTAPHSILPAPLAALSVPQRSGLTSELRQVSILDLIREQKESAAREETLARSRFRPSLRDLKVAPMTPPAASAEPGPPAPAVLPTDNGAEPAAAGPASENEKLSSALYVAPAASDQLGGFELDGPTVVNRREPGAAPVAPEPVAASSKSSREPAPSAASNRAIPAGAVPSLAADPTAPAAASVNTPLPASAASSATPALARPELLPLADPLSPPAPQEVKPWIWAAVLGPLIAIILFLLVKILTR